MSHFLPRTDSDLARATMKSVGLLTCACVLFVGALSLAAVLVTSRVVGGGGAAGPGGDRERASSQEPASAAAKKPLSI